MIIINPVGFLTLTIWNWGVFFSPLARRQYAQRHNGHSPQISNSDLAFSLHALVISSITLCQVIFYAWKNGPKRSEDGDEARPLLSESTTTASPSTGKPVIGSTIKPSIPLQISLVAVLVSAIASGGLVWAGKAEWLDWLYFISTLKLLISIVKYVPQVILNYKLKSAEGLAIWVILLVSRLCEPCEPCEPRPEKKGELTKGRI